jgi:hypothetical protein
MVPRRYIAAIGPVPTLNNVVRVAASGGRTVAPPETGPVPLPVSLTAALWSRRLTASNFGTSTGAGVKTSVAPAWPGPQMRCLAGYSLPTHSDGAAAPPTYSKSLLHASLNPCKSTIISLLPSGQTWKRARAVWASIIVLTTSG